MQTNGAGFYLQIENPATQKITMAIMTGVLQKSPATHVRRSTTSTQEILMTSIITSSTITTCKLSWPGNHHFITKQFAHPENKSVHNKQTIFITKTKK